MYVFIITIIIKKNFQNMQFINPFFLLFMVFFCINLEEKKRYLLLEK